MYLLSEIQKVYRSQGQNIHDKHFEVIIRKMMSKVSIGRAGDSKYLPGDAVDRQQLRKLNEQFLADGKQPAKFQDLLLGVTKASLSTDSWLSASSFQHTIKVLARHRSTTDPLYGGRRTRSSASYCLPVRALCPDGLRRKKAKAPPHSGRRSARPPRRTDIRDFRPEQQTGTSSEKCRSHL
jgi:hypothetical protein